MTSRHKTGAHPFLWQASIRPVLIHFYDKPAEDQYSSIFMTSWQKTGAHPFYIGMYIHIYTHIYVHIYTSQKECLHIFYHACLEDFVWLFQTIHFDEIYWNIIKFDEFTTTGFMIEGKFLNQKIDGGMDPAEFAICHPHPPIKNCYHSPKENIQDQTKNSSICWRSKMVIPKDQGCLNLWSSKQNDFRPHVMVNSHVFWGSKKGWRQGKPRQIWRGFFVQCTSTKRLRGWAWLMWIVFQVSVSIHGPFLRIQPHKHEPSYGHFLAQGTLVLK